MRISAITALLWLALALPAFGQAKSSSNTTSPSAQPKAALAEVRAIVRELEGHTGTLRELLANHRSLVEQRPETEEQNAKYEAALERLLARVQSAHATLVDTLQRLDKAITGELPTGLAKDVATARNEAEPQRAMAEQVLAKRKPPAARKTKPAKEPPPSTDHEDLDL